MKMYFIAIVLPPDLDKEVIAYKNFMLEKYDCRVGLKSPAHITIVPPFWMEEEKEPQLISDIDIISNGIGSFILATKNFSAFKPRTIFIDVQPSQQLQELKQKADDFFNLRDYKIKKENRPFHPHITIATRDLYKRDFAEAWAIFKNKGFQSEWQANGLSLLRHNTKKWDVVHTSHFIS